MTTFGTDRSIGDIARAIASLLDDCLLNLMQVQDEFEEGSKDPKAVEIQEHIQQIQRTRESVSRFRQSRFQTPNVFPVIIDVETDAIKIKKLLEEDGRPFQVANAIRDLECSDINLKAQIPGNYSEVSENRVTGSGSIQNNAPIGVEPRSGHTVSIVRGNQAESSYQNNAPIHGLAPAFTDFTHRQQRE